MVSRVRMFVPLMIVVMFACNSQQAPVEDDAEPGETAPFDLVIGSLPALTGPFASYGEMAVKATDLAVDVAKDAAQEAGIPVSVTIASADTEGEVQPAVSAARKVVGDGSSCITGMLLTPETIALSRSVTVPRELPLFPLGGSMEISKIEDDDTVYRATPPDNLQVLVLADALEDLAGGASGNTVSIAYRNEPYGEGLAEGFIQEWEGRGGEIQGPTTFDPEQASYDSEADQIVSNDPDAYLIIDYPDSYASVGAALLRTGKFDARRVVAPDTLHFAEIPKEIEPESLEGALTVAIGADEETKTSKSFDELWKDAPGPERLPLDTHVFDNNILCFLAAVAAGSADGPAMVEHIRPISGPPGEKYTFLELADAVAALSAGEDIDYEGVSGPLDFDDAGDPTAAVYDLFRYEDGKAKFLEQIQIRA